MLPEWYCKWPWYERRGAVLVTANKRCFRVHFWYQYRKLVRRVLNNREYIRQRTCIIEKAATSKMCKKKPIVERHKHLKIQQLTKNGNSTSTRQSLVNEPIPNAREQDLCIFAAVDESKNMMDKLHLCVDLTGNEQVEYTMHSWTQHKSPRIVYYDTFGSSTGSKISRNFYNETARRKTGTFRQASHLTWTWLSWLYLGKSLNSHLRT